MSTVKEQFEAAKAYIDAKQYDKARRVLRRIEHPKAEEWIKRIDTIPSVRKRDQTKGVVLIGCFMALIIAMLGVWAFQIVGGQRIAEGTARADVFVECVKLTVRAENKFNCSAWTDLIFQQNHRIIMDCFMANESRSDLFHACLRLKNIYSEISP